jgi:hypothetical protein
MLILSSLLTYILTLSFLFPDFFVHLLPLFIFYIFYPEMTPGSIYISGQRYLCTALLLQEEQVHYTVPVYSPAVPGAYPLYCPYIQPCCLQEERVHYTVLLQEEHVQSWTLSGREAEALHAQEEDEAASREEEEDEEEDPIKKIIQSRYCSPVQASTFNS